MPLNDSRGIGDGSLAYLCGNNQYQDPGLEPERRAEAIRAVKHAQNRDVFYLDEVLTFLETRASAEPDGGWYWLQSRSILEEMLSHGSR